MTAHSDSGSLRHGRYWPPAASAILAVVLIGAVAVWDAVGDYVAAVDGRQERLRILAGAGEAQVHVKLDQIGLLLADVAERSQSGYAPGALEAYMAARSRAFPAAQHVLVTDATGTVIAATQSDLRGVDATNRPYFTRPRTEPPDGAIFVSPQFASGNAGVAIIALSRAIVDEHGTFRGVVSVSVLPEYFSDLLRTVKPDPGGTLLLVNGDRAVIAATDPLDSPGESAIVDPALKALIASGHPDINDRIPTANGRGEQFISVHSVGNLGLYVIVAQGADVVLTLWRRRAAINGIAYILLFVAVVFLLELSRRRERESRELREQFELIADNVPGAIYQLRTAASGRMSLVYASKGFLGITGVASEDVPIDMRKFWSGVHPDDRTRLKACIDNSAKTLEPLQCEFRRTLPDGRKIWIHSRSTLRRGPGGAIHWYGYAGDVTEQLRNEQDLRIAATAFETQEGIFITDAAGTIIRVNRAFGELTGYGADEAVGKTPALLKSGRHDAAFYRGMRAELVRNRFWQGEIWNRRKSGEVFPEWQTITAVPDAEGTVTHYVAAFSDITLRKAAEERIHKLAFFDPLTKLPNRRLLMDRLGQALAASRRSARHGALMFLDLDHFKALNDSRGHDAGDRLLVEVARRLRACLRHGDTVARQGGDEFVILLENLDADRTRAGARAKEVLAKLQSALARPYDFGPRAAADGVDAGTYLCTASIGVCLFRGYEDEIEKLLKRIDVAMYQAKAAGRNNVRFFDPAMQAELEMRAKLESDLRRALDGGELRLFYQLQADMSGRAIGAEALLRWIHPTRGLLPASEFIPVAEDAHLMSPIGDWALTEACKQLCAWSAHPETSALRLAVNVHAAQVRRADFVDTVRGALTRSEADPRRLRLELTENLVLDSLEDTVAKMRSLKSLGIGFSIDDFGIGYSAFSHLQRMPLDELKIDGSFVRDIVEDPNGEAIVRAIIAVGRSLGFRVTAEGVETKAQRALLKALGCQAFQGNLLGPPVTLEEFLPTLKRQGASV